MFAVTEPDQRLAQQQLPPRPNIGRNECVADQLRSQRTSTLGIALAKPRACLGECQLQRGERIGGVLKKVFDRTAQALGDDLEGFHRWPAATQLNLVEERSAEILPGDVRQAQAQV